MTNVAQQDKPIVNTMHTTVYSHDGYKLNIVLAIDTVADIGSYLDEIRAAGLTPNIPGLEPGQEKEAIAAVVRRASTKGTPVIDFYAHWQYEGKFGAHKYAHMYLDTPEQVAEFEAHSGLRLADLPLYEGQQAVKREFGKPTRFETEVRRPFEIVRTPDGQHDTGMAKYIYSYAVPMPTAPQPPTPPKQAATASKSNASPKPRATTTEPAQTAFDAPPVANWWTDSKAITYVKENIGGAPGVALGKMQRQFADFATPDDMIAAYHDYTSGNAVQNAAATSNDTYTIDDPLKGDMLDIVHVEPQTGKRFQWIGKAWHEGHPIRILLYKEDEIAIRNLGYDTSLWDKPNGQDYAEGISVVTLMTDGGRKVASVWDKAANGLVATERGR